MLASPEFVITPDTIHILGEHIHSFRRIYTDGRDWPEEIEPSFAGYSIGRWVDRNGSGQFDVLEVETRGMKGPRVMDSTGLPLHKDNQTIVKERIYLDEKDPNILYDKITTIDHAFTRPWTAKKSYLRDPAEKPVWRESICAEGNPWLKIGGNNYFLSAGGLLMPTWPPTCGRHLSTRRSAWTAGSGSRAGSSRDGRGAASQVPSVGLPVSTSRASTAPPTGR